ncbi:MAG: hypothetical protein P0Y50_02005 [Candidatus Brevundimonas colombiensis]|uniref:Uncharacterized protein n=1 Tax=Candidatus Brevundimonas colombiensis TaxID=3121376 RepID=A0AAJ6BM68_9CAUL|nr:hypothetical protein [Brevundimonas sp.]WEK40401.1 MAG: hypothetical protein P0Y50_02005 [Brevundimonas sp.]
MTMPMTFGGNRDIISSMITNILDRRIHIHEWRSVDAVAEATWHDNAPPGTQHHDNADATASIKLGDTMSSRSGISVTDAIAWAQQYPDEVTLYLYDLGTWEPESEDF